ncbi:MAG: 50S ribosomal protein L25 [Candidatus Cloacimonetes bacterium]|nr:50S ribosomal protein L25 [Candidatus Cloacimonadota bacterium]
MNIKIEAQLRDKGKRSDLNKFRNQGYIPAIIYGEGKEGTKILLQKIPFLKNYKKSLGEVAFFEIKVNGKSYTTLIKEKQIHPVTREFTHIDFVELHKGKKITLEIPINYTGEALGTQEGGLLEILHRKIEISCLPKDIPEEIKVDVSNLEIGDSIHFADIEMPENVDTNMSDITTLVAVRAPRKEEIIEVEEEVEEEVEGEEGAEEAEAAEEQEEETQKTPEKTSEK